MEFFTIQNFTDNQLIQAQGIDIMKMSKAFKVIEKQTDFKTVDSIMPLNFVFIEPSYTVSPNDVVFSYKDKNMSFLLMNPDSVATLTDIQNNVFYCAIHEGVLNVTSDKLKLENTLSKKTFQSDDVVVAKAIDWLDNGRVGLSSATMCATFFPQLKNHHKLRDKYDFDDNLEINWPHDNGDFSRCQKFLEAVPEVKSRLPELKSLCKEWNNLVDKWDEIAVLMDANSDAAYSLIRSCLDKKSLKP